MTLSATPSLRAQDGHGGETPNPPTHEFDPQGDRKKETWADVGIAPNPVAFTIAPDGGIYVAQSARAGNAVNDTRTLRALHGVWEDLQMNSVEDRLAQINRWTANGDFEEDYFTRTADTIRLVRDTDGDGAADTSTDFAGDFNDPLDGIGAGVLFLDGKVYYTCIPHVWVLEDYDGDGLANNEDERASLSYGYGVRWAFYGHDLHGLVMGPDGRIYFSMGDRGYNLTTQEGDQIVGPDRGAIFRMWPDGSGLELFAEGVRNPQELAFDNYGNLFTGDNNCDAGDDARFVHVVYRGDSGWRQDVQSLDGDETKWDRRGPWMRERMWLPRLDKNDPTQPAWLIPPIANVGYGPSGLAHYPGTGDALADNGDFLMANFPGEVRRVRLEPDGAGFKVAEDVLFHGGNNVTDVCFGYDGRIYLSDWGEGWGPNEKGHLFTLTNEQVHNNDNESAAIAEVQALFSGGFNQRQTEDLINLLAHRDQRVRLHAQYEVAKHDGAIEPLSAIASNTDTPQLQRIHAIWTLGMIARHDPSAIDALISLWMSDSMEADPQIRVQTIKTMGDLNVFPAWALTQFQWDEHPQVRFYTAIALGRSQSEGMIGPLLFALDENDNDDALLRHAYVTALAEINQPEAMIAAAADHGDAAQLGCVLALRKLDHPALAQYLDHDNTLIVAEAARAIYDKWVVDAMPTLAAMLDRDLPEDLRIEPIMRRAIQANTQIGGDEAALRLAHLAAVNAYDTRWRALALEELNTWHELKEREGVWGAWRPREGHDKAQLVAALESTIEDLRAADEQTVVSRANVMHLKYVREATPEQLEVIAKDADEDPAIREAALGLLIQQDKNLAHTLSLELANAPAAHPRLRMDARSYLLGRNADIAIDLYIQALQDGMLIEQQEAVDVLAVQEHDKARAAIAALSLELAQERIDLGLVLEVYEAVSASSDTEVRARASAYAARRNPSGENQVLPDTVMLGGDIARGRSVFIGSAAECQRCHGSGLEDTGTLGPPLGGIALMHDPAINLQSLLDPSAQFAAGYQSVSITLDTGEIKTGRILNQSPNTTTLIDADGDESVYSADTIVSTTASTVSAMPAMGDKLTAREIRDVMAYLATLDMRPAAGSGGSAASGHASHGPTIANAFDDINHGMVLPAILMGLSLLLGALLLFTVWISGSAS